MWLSLRNIGGRTFVRQRYFYLAMRKLASFCRLCLCLIACSAWVQIR